MTWNDESPDEMTAEAALVMQGFAIPTSSADSVDSAARSIVQTEMINRTAYRDLLDTGMDAPQAEAVAVHLPDWSQFATKQDLATLRSDLQGEMKDLQATLIRWMVGLFLTSTAVLGALLTSSNLLG